MNRQENRDALGGALIAAFGIGMLIWALVTLPMGVPRRMGPGMFPAGIGGLTALAGLGVLVQALWQRARTRSGDTCLRVNIRAVIFISLALLAFGLLVGPFGMVPAIVALIWLCLLSEAGTHPAVGLVLSALMPAATWLIFKLGLGLPMAMIRWPF